MKLRWEIRAVPTDARDAERAVDEYRGLNLVLFASKPLAHRLWGLGAVHVTANPSVSAVRHPPADAMQAICWLMPGAWPSVELLTMAEKHLARGCELVELSAVSMATGKRLELDVPRAGLVACTPAVLKGAADAHWRTVAIDRPQVIVSCEMQELPAICTQPSTAPRPSRARHVPALRHVDRAGMPQPAAMGGAGMIQPAARGADWLSVQSPTAAWRADEPVAGSRLSVGGVSMTDPATYLDIALCGPHDMIDAQNWRFVERAGWPHDQLACELLVRKLRCRWIGLTLGGQPPPWDDMARACAAREDRWMITAPGVAFVNTRYVRLMPPAIPDLRTWVEECQKHAYCTAVDADGRCVATRNAPPAPAKHDGGLKVAVLSMCGVTGNQDAYGVAEDRYGLGGEHQVVHWLMESFLKRPEVAECHIYDTHCIGMVPGGYYDLILSNSCWVQPPQPRAGGVSIFWHFNTNANHGDERTIAGYGYTHVWSNSPLSVDRLRDMGLTASLKHLNASSSCHDPYPWDSKLFHHDVCYVGGYQTEYKGRELLRSYIRQCCAQPFDFAIYGNRKWRVEVQRQAVKTDRGYFSEEDVETAYEPHYQGILHPHDFRILAKNCKIWVNFNSADQRPLGMCNDRVIWGMYAGAFFITDDTQEQRALYGECCDYSTGGDDLLKKIEYWLTRDAQRAEMAGLSHRRMTDLALTTDGTVDAALAVYAERAK